MTAAIIAPDLASSELFNIRLQQAGLAPLQRDRVDTLQINLGKKCNMACHHCHVEAGPTRTEMMTTETVDRLIELLDSAPHLSTVDLTGGAPELNNQFRRIVVAARQRGLRVIDRCNLSILFEPGQEDLAAFLADQHVHIVASLPCYSADNVERQRGKGAFDTSIAALKLLNKLGYGLPASELRLDLVYNPVGASLPPAQGKLQAKYKYELGRLFGIQFHELLTITNMPIKRFEHALRRDQQYETYMGLLLEHFNPATTDQVMCRSLVSVGWDGLLYDCDFNQMLELPADVSDGAAPTLWNIASLNDLAMRPIATGNHCFGCTAGAGSSCGGALSTTHANKSEAA